MFDTHCHLNFSAFKKILPDVVKRAQSTGVTHFIVPGTDVARSMKAVEVAEKYPGIFAAVGIHPHHVFQYQITNQNNPPNMKDDLQKIEELLHNPKVVAIGEVGMDKHVYQQTKYPNYKVDDLFVQEQTKLFRAQIRLAVRYGKSLIIHNREAKKNVLSVLSVEWNTALDGRTVFHCCEPDTELLEFAKQHHIYVGVDGDVTYSKEKQEFMKQIPLEMLVLETDSPFLLPEPLRSQKQYPNEPRNLPVIVDFIAKILGKDPEEIKKITTENAKILFTPLP